MSYQVEVTRIVWGRDYPDFLNVVHTKGDLIETVWWDLEHSDSRRAVYSFRVFDENAATATEMIAYGDASDLRRSADELFDEWLSVGSLPQP